MHKKMIVLALCGFALFLISGCMVRTYPVVKERVDQDLTWGNRGFLVGEPGAVEEPRRTTRRIQKVEVELYPIRVEKDPPQDPKPRVEPAMIKAPVSRAPAPAVPEIETVVISPPATKAVVMQQYTIKDGDTLQKVSQKFYGTTRRWQEIYEVNRDILKSPDSIFVGQVIQVPVEENRVTK